MQCERRDKTTDFDWKPVAYADMISNLKRNYQDVESLIETMKNDAYVAPTPFADYRIVVD
jgi:hypothetical protein